MQLFQVATGEVAHLFPLEMFPQPLNRVEVWGVRRQRLYVQALGPHLLHELRHGHPTVDGRTIPDNQSRPLELMAKVFQELDGVQTVQRVLPDQSEDPAISRQSTHDRQVVVCLPLIHHRRMPLQPIRFDHAGQQVEPTLIDESQGPPFLSGTAFQRGPDLVAPPSDGFLVALDGAGDGDLGRPANLLEDTGDVMLVVIDAKLLLDNLTHPSADPEIAAEAVGLRTVPEEVSNQLPLAGEQFSRRPDAQVTAEGVGTTFSTGAQPLTHSRSANAQSGGDLALGPALLVQLPGTHPPPLPPVLRRGWGSLHTSILPPQSVNFSARRSVISTPADWNR